MITPRRLPFAIKTERRRARSPIFIQMSVLMQELKRADDQHQKETTMDNLQLDETALDRTHRFIKEYFWTALTRRIDAAASRPSRPRF